MYKEGKINRVELKIKFMLLRVSVISPVARVSPHLRDFELSK